MLAVLALASALVHRGPEGDTLEAQHAALRHRLETLRARTAAQEAAQRAPEEPEPPPARRELREAGLAVGVVTGAAALCAAPLSSLPAAGARLAAVWGLGALVVGSRSEVGAATACAVLSVLWAVRAASAHGWKLAESKEPTLLREWLRRVGLFDRARVQSQLRFHALRGGFLHTTWGVPVPGVPPGFSFALYLRACSDAVCLELLHANLRSIGLVLLLAVAAWPLGLLLGPFTAVLVWGGAGCLLAVLLWWHLERVLDQLAPRSRDTPPPYVHQVVTPGRCASKHDQLFLFGAASGPGFVLDCLRALLWFPLSVVVAWRGSWELLALAAAVGCLHTYLVASAVAQYTVASSTEMQVRHALVTGSDRCLAKRSAYRRIAQHVKVAWSLRAREWEERADAWPPMRAQQLADARQLLPPELRRTHVAKGCALVGLVVDRAVVDAWFDFFAVGDVLPDRMLAWVVAGVEQSTGPLPETSAELLPLQLTPESLAAALEKLHLPASEGTCAELLLSCEQPFASSLVALLRRLD